MQIYKKSFKNFAVERIMLQHSSFAWFANCKLKDVEAVLHLKISSIEYVLHCLLDLTSF